jgi:hypothetical protein
LRRYTTGGADRGALQWRLVGEDGAPLPQLAGGDNKSVAAKAKAFIKAKAAAAKSSATATGGGTGGVEIAAAAEGADAAEAAAAAAATGGAITFAAAEDEVYSDADADDGDDDDVEGARYRASFPDEVAPRRPRETAPVYQTRRMANYRKNRMAGPLYMLHSVGPVSLKAAPGFNPSSLYTLDSVYP